LEDRVDRPLGAELTQALAHLEALTLAVQPLERVVIRQDRLDRIPAHRADPGEQRAVAGLELAHAALHRPRTIGLLGEELGGDEDRALELRHRRTIVPRRLRSVNGKSWRRGTSCTSCRCRTGRDRYGRPWATRVSPARCAGSRRPGSTSARRA